MYYAETLSRRGSRQMECPRWSRRVEFPVPTSLRHGKRCSQVIEKVSLVDFFGAERFAAS